MSSTDVAIIGLACRFPAAAGPGAFWRLIRDGREATRFTGEAAEFDADFFNLSPREASAMDPRQRLALELTWELLEDAFLIPETLRGEPVSVFLGAMTDDYAALTLRDLADNLDHHSFTGISRAMIANRISYAFGLRGPSMTVDSGQSSSLVAVHLGCESVATGRSALAIAGGVHLNLADEIGMLEREFGAVSVSGHTYAFDRRADGYVRGEGGGLVLLKPLPSALDDGDRIHAVIRGGAVGNAGNGATAQTVPSASGEADVIRRALADAGLRGDDIDYIEAHGTGTKVGDAIEAQALGQVFAERAHDPVRVGSVKTNIGHAGAAAGIAGLLKAVLAIEHGAIPPSLNYADPATELNHLGLQVNTALAPWPPAARARRAGVSSFGMGGTNAHLVVEQFERPSAQPQAQPADADEILPWVLSGRSEQALANQARRLSAYLADADASPLDIAWSLVGTRTVFEHRAVVVGGDRAALATGLAALAAGDSKPGVAVGRAGSSESLGKTVFVFPGQGSQWLGMGRQLYERFDVFARALDEAAAAVDTHLRAPLREVMWGTDPDLLRNTEFAQPALFAIGVALTALWQSFGVTPDVVMGHSVGEITAACVAGVLSLADASLMVAARGRLMAGLPAGGVMVAVGAAEADVTGLLDGGVSIAAVNGPDAVVLSGAQAPVDALADRLAREGRRVRRLAVSHAFHSQLMQPIVAEFSAAVAGIEVGEQRIALVSNVTGQLAGDGYGSPRYWADHVGHPVRFFEGVRAAEAAGAGIFLELGPGAALTAAVDQSLSAERAVSVPCLIRDRPEAESLLGAAGQLFTRGLDPNWAAAFAGLNARRVELPTYGFVRQRFWLGAEGAGATGGPPATASRTPDLAHRLLGLAPDDQRRALVELVCEHAAAVSGHPGGHAIDPGRAFGDLGFDSMIGVELRNRLTSHTGLALSRTLIFDYPTPAALADHLRRQLLHDEPAESDEEKMWSELRKIPVRELRRTGLLEKLLLLAGSPESSAPDANSGADDIDALSPDALIAMALSSADEEDTER